MVYSGTRGAWICLVLLAISLLANGQQLVRPEASDPYGVQSFNDAFIKEHRIKRATVQVSVKSPGKVIVHRKGKLVFYFDEEGRLEKKEKISVRANGETENQSTSYYFLNGKLNREEITQASGNSIIYHSYNGNEHEQKILKQDEPGGRYSQQESMVSRTEKEGNLLIYKVYNGSRIVETITEEYHPENGLVSRETEQHPNRYLTEATWNYEFGKLVDLTIKAGKREDVYAITYGKNSIIRKIQHSENGRLLETVEYFYYNGILESLLESTPGSDELEITNYSYEFY
ncbi:MAG: hypothetical protein V4616_01285 [Bacteroidota bacterium]